MKVLFLSDSYPPDSLGGYETACWTTVEGLRSRGHKALVLTNAPEVPDAPHVARRLHRMRDSPSLLQQAGWELSDNRFLARAIRSFRPDLISVWRAAFFFPSLYLTLRSSGVPTVFNLHDIWLAAHLRAYDDLRAAWARPGSGPVRRAAKTLVRWGFDRLVPGFRQPVSIQDVALDHAVFCSRYVLLRHEQAGIPLRETRVIYNGIDLTQFRGEPRSAESIPSLLFVGRLVEEKGAHVVIRAVARLRRAGRPVRLTIAGLPSYPWEYPESLKDLVRTEGLDDIVVFRDSVAKESLPELYRAHHLLAFPSSKPEGFPMTLLEAMACGCAVAGTLTGGTSELLQDGVNALVCPPEDVPALAENIDRILGDEDLRRRLAQTGAKLVRERYGLEYLSAATEDYYLATGRAFRRQ